jgi:prepilin-type N-terminal cleavage/methylation domain-containing protein
MKTKGFTIIETLVAVTILATVVIGAMTAAQAGLSSYAFSKDETTAIFLAQEAIEQIRNIRDENRLNDRYWLNSIGQSGGDACAFGNACMVDPVAGSSTTICTGGPGNCPVLRQDATTGFFGYNAAWTPTKFTRQIILTEISADEIVITVTVNWTKGILSRQVKARENIFNW